MEIISSVIYSISLFLLVKGVARGGRGEIPPPPETEKIVVEKWCYFRKLYF